MIIIQPNDRGYTLIYDKEQKTVIHYFLTGRLSNNRHLLEEHKRRKIFIKNFESNSNRRFSNKNINTHTVQYVKAILKSTGMKTPTLITVRNLKEYLKSTYTSPTVKGNRPKPAAPTILELTEKLIYGKEEPFYKQLLTIDKETHNMIDALLVLSYCLDGFKPKPKRVKKIPGSSVITKNSDKIATQTMDFLEENKDIGEDVTELLAQTAIGAKVLFAGIARNKAKRLEKLTQAQEMMEDHVFDTDFFESQNDYDKVQLLKLAANLNKESMEFMKYISQLDFQQVQLDLQKLQVKEAVATAQVDPEDKVKMLALMRKAILSGNLK